MKNNSIITKKQSDRLVTVRLVAKNFTERIAENNNSNALVYFPYDNYKELKEIDYHMLTIPKYLGGGGINVTEFIQLQIELAKYAPSTALGIGWHLGLLLQAHESSHWPIQLYKKLVSNIIEHQLLFNNAATELQTGSPTHGGKPTTTAFKNQNGWRIKGRKSFTTLSPVLGLVAVTARIHESDDVGIFLINCNDPNIIIEHTWDSLSMRETGSHDLIINDVQIEEEALIHHVIPGITKREGWALHIPAVYYGIAENAYDEVIRSFKKNLPNNFIHPSLIQQKIGQMNVKLLSMKHFLFSVAKEWDEGSKEEREQMQDTLCAIKIFIINQSIEVVDLAIRITGPLSLSKNHPLSKAYKDVRAGLHNPPMEDLVHINLGKTALEVASQF